PLLQCPCHWGSESAQHDAGSKPGQLNRDCVGKSIRQQKLYAKEASEIQRSHMNMRKTVDK
ncbi:hypothetical protein SK128_004069, partial [Halocaridina rubra]